MARPPDIVSAGRKVTKPIEMLPFQSLHKSNHPPYSVGPELFTLRNFFLHAARFLLPGFIIGSARLLVELAHIRAASILSGESPEMLNSLKEKEESVLALRLT